MSETDQEHPDQTERTHPELTEAERLRLRTDGKHVCPYCGTIASAGVMRCQRCGMEDTPETRQATRSRLGPWFVLQSRNPAAPGMNFATLLGLVRKGQVTPMTVVRGPTTQQCWSFASRVKGLSREFGVCWECGRAIKVEDNLCPHCQRLQEPPMNADVMVEGRPAGLREDEPRILTRGADAMVPVMKPPPHERILSQKELAAAFAITAPENQPAEEAPPAEPVRRRRRRPGLRAAAIALVALAAGAAGYYAYDPAGARQRYAKGMEWVGNLKQNVGGSAKQPPAPVVTKPAEPNAVTAGHREPQTEVPAEIPPAPATTQAIVTETPEPPKPEPATAPAAAAPDPPAVDEQATQASARSEPQQPPPAPAPAASAEAQSAKAMSLLAKAMEAERANRFADAATLYEEIRALPRDLWPVGLERRLASARERAGK